MPKDRDEQEARREVVRRLRLILDRTEMSQTHLARRLGQAPSAVSDWFTKNALPSGETLVRMFQLPEFRNVSAEWLLTGQGSAVKGTNIPAQKAYDLGAVTALTQALDEIERLRDMWTAARPAATRTPESAAAAAKGARVLRRVAETDTVLRGKKKARQAR